MLNENTKKIVTESFNIILITAIISAFGGIGMESISDRIIVLIPLVIMFPALNNMSGGFGATISAKFTTHLFKGEINQKNWWTAKLTKDLIKKLFIISILSSIYLGVASYVLAMFLGYGFSLLPFIKVILVAIFVSTLLLFILFFVSVVLGFKVYNKGQDPDNFLIPVTTALADLGATLLLCLFVILLF